MTNYLILVLVILLIVDFAYRQKRKIFFEKELLRQSLITKMSYIRQRLINMVQEKEIDPDSAYFKFIYTATRYLIRALWVKGLNKELANLNIIKNSLFAFCPEHEQKCDKCLFSELENLNNEQINYFCEVSYAVLNVYQHSSLFNFVIYIIFDAMYKKKTIRFVLTIPIIIKLKEIIPETWKLSYSSFKTFYNNYSYKNNVKNNCLCVA